MVSAAGIGAARTWQAARDAEALLGAPSRLRGRTVGIHRVAEVQGFDPSCHFDPRRLAALDPVAQYGIVAAREAVAAAGIDFTALDPARTMCVIGTGAGGEVTHDDASARVYVEGASRLHPLTVPRLMVSAVASQVAMEFGIKGGVYVVSSACASSTHAIGQAFNAVRAGQVDAVITGGSEACLTYGCLKAWDALHVVSDDACRPFSRGRRGLILGEGAALMVLEPWDRASRRGADILAELTGFGMSSDAGQLTSPDVDGMQRAMAAALNDARLPIDAVDHVNAHGTGTRLNDSSECEALGRLFGTRAHRLPVTGSKSVIGHLLGASGAIETGLAIQSLRHQVLAPTANFEADDPECAVDPVPNTARDARVRCVLSNSFAFGGLNAALVVNHV